MLNESLPQFAFPRPGFLGSVPARLDRRARRRPMVGAVRSGPIEPQRTALVRLPTLFGLWSSGSPDSSLRPGFSPSGTGFLGREIRSDIRQPGHRRPGDLGVFPLLRPCFVEGVASLARLRSEAVVLTAAKRTGKVAYRRKRARRTGALSELAARQRSYGRRARTRVAGPPISPPAYQQTRRGP